MDSINHISSNNNCFSNSVPSINPKTNPLNDLFQKSDIPSSSQSINLSHSSLADRVYHLKHNIMISKLKQMKPFALENYACKQFVYLSKNEIEKQGGICLTPCQNDLCYVGIVAVRENKKWVLHICPGGGYMKFSENDFQQMMKTVADGLSYRGIIPCAFVIDGRHPGDTFVNFQKWQKSI